MGKRKTKVIESDFEKEDEFDLPEITRMLRDDLAELDEGITVKLVVHKRKNNEMIITNVPTELRKAVYEAAKGYVRTAWRNYHQHQGLNFVPVIRERKHELQ